MASNNPPSKPDISLLHIKLELTRIDVLIQREVQRWQQAGQDTGDSYRGLYVTDNEVDHLLKQPFGFNWGQSTNMDPRIENYFQEAYSTAELQTKEFTDQAAKDQQDLRLLNLAKVFILNPFDLDLLLLCLAPSFDLKYERIYGYLQDDVTRKQPGINLILNLLAPPGTDRFAFWTHFVEAAPLFDNHIIEKQAESTRVPLLRQTLVVDETIINWLLGSYQPNPDLMAYFHLIPTGSSATDQLLAGHFMNNIRPDQLSNPHFIFSGVDLASHESAARLISSQYKRPLLTANLGAMVHDGLSPFKSLKTAMRDARLTGAILFVTGWDTCLTDDRTAQAGLLSEICRFDDTLILSGIASWQVSGIDREDSFVWINFPNPSYAQRCSLWNHYLARVSPASKIDITALAGQFLLTSSQIRDACLSAMDAAHQTDQPVTEDILFNAARAHSNPRLSSLARKVIPRYGWDDIVLPTDQVSILHEIIDTVCGRPKVLEEWGVGEKLAPSSGVTVLFSGPPGTGKTMSAQIIARELGLDLYKIDLSSIVSKYIGETEKNMERIFSEAESSNAILFFDEADALFGKRSEVRDSHDRYANIEISYLLQRMEAYDGVTILATNLRANLDEAFTRRLQFSVNFPFPDEADRLKIWKALFPSELPRAADIDLPLLAHRFKLAGGNIRNIIVNAAYLASADGGRVTMGHIFHSTHREYQKLGRLLGENDLISG